MIDLLASTVATETANSPGWFLVHAIGVGMGILGSSFSGHRGGNGKVSRFLHPYACSGRGTPCPPC